MSSDSRDEEYIQQREWQGHEEGEMQRGEGDLECDTATSRVTGLDWI